MGLELHHLRLSQSERIVWLLEEMGIPYELKVYQRDAQTALAPAELKAINPFETAPYFRDTSVTPVVELSESGAIAEYVLGVYGDSAQGPPMMRKPGDVGYGPYLQWFHWASGALQPSVSRRMGLVLSGAPITGFYKERMESQYRLMDSHLASNKWFAGDEISAADCMIMVSLSTMRGFSPWDMGPYPNILRWMKDVAARPAYSRMLEKAEGGMKPMIEPIVRRFTEFAGFKSGLENFKL